MKNSRNTLWARWIFFTTLTFLPFILAVLMFAFQIGFIRSVWLATLVVAFFSFVQSQRTIAQMRGLKEDSKFDRWLQPARQRAISGKTREELATANIDRRTLATKAMSNKATDFRRPAIWRGTDQRLLQRRLYDLFAVLGFEVKNVAAHGGFGAGLQVEGATYISISNTGKRVSRDEIKKLEEFVASSSSWRHSILVSPAGSERSARDYVDKSGVILLDADNLARLARRELPT